MLTVTLALLCAAGALVAEPPSPQALAAFASSVSKADRRVEIELRDGPFLFIDHDARRDALIARLKNGATLVDPRLNGKVVPGGLLHHRRAIAFAPGASLAQAIAIARDYDSFANYYAPTVTRSHLLQREGDAARFLLQIQRKTAGITATLNVEHALLYFPLNASRAASSVRAVRIAEVAAAGTPQEHELPPHRDRGFLWQLQSYWRFAEREGGVYIQVEAISLSRPAPLGLNWLFGSFLQGVHADFLADLVEGTRRAILNGRARLP
jgi:hypothetical protein